MAKTKHITIIGAGIAGLESAVQLAGKGYRVTLVEKGPLAGGKLNHWAHLFPDFSDPAVILSHLKEQIKQKSINIIFNTEVTKIVSMNGTYEVLAGGYFKLKSDAVIISSGFSLYDATMKEEYGYGIFDNVITSTDMEKTLKEQRKIITKNGKTPERIAIIHCVGSRDSKSGNTYCSKVCCITGVKQAITLNQLLPECEIFCFYMDLRLYGLNFDQIYLTAQKQYKIQFIRGRLSEAAEKHDKSLQIKAEDTLSGRPLRMDVDMMILLVGIQPGKTNDIFISEKTVAGDENGFFKPRNYHTKRNCTDKPGIFIAGSCICPMSVCETIENGKSVAMEVMNYLVNN